MNEELTDDGIDLRQYVRGVLRHWKMILAMTLMSAVAAGIITGITTTHTYEATAIIYAQGLEAGSDRVPLPSKAYPDLALSDEVVSALFEEEKPTLPPGVDTLTKFRQQLRAVPAADPSLLRLAVRDTDPEQAAQIANAWARTLMDAVGRLQGLSDDSTDAKPRNGDIPKAHNFNADNLLVYETQLKTAKRTKEGAEEALQNFPEDQIIILTAELSSQQAVLTDYLNRAHRFGVLVQDAQNLHARLAKLDPSGPPRFTDDILMLTLSMQTFGGNGSSLQSQPSPTGASSINSSVLMQISPGQSVSGSIVEQAAVVDDLLDTLKARAEEAKTEITILKPKILDLQSKLVKARRQQADLTQVRDFAQTQYLALVSKVEQARIAEQESALRIAEQESARELPSRLGKIVQLASRAMVPTEQVGQATPLNPRIGGLAGLIMGILLSLVWQWWKAPMHASDRPAV